MSITFAQKTISRRLVDSVCDQIKQNPNNMPFSAAIVKNDRIFVLKNNEVIQNGDPCAHAEIVAIREACKELNTISLIGYDLYSSCEPCPMCLSAAYWAEIANIYFLNSRSFVKNYFDDDYILNEIKKPHSKKAITIKQIEFPEAKNIFITRKQILDGESNGAS